MSFAHEPVPSKSPTRCIQTDHYWVPCRCKVKTPTCVYFGSWDLVDVPLDDNESCVANPPACASHDNLTAMIHLSPPCLLHALALRFAAKQIYTSCGSMLLSINPYHTIPGMYGDAQAKQYKTRLGNEASPPHLFSTAQTAMDALVKTETNQSILISGESGAGKTVATKCILVYLAGKHDTKSALVLKANPLLELFGNAPTLRNHNSSRFGKYLRVGINPLDGSLASMGLTTYLLETSRLLHHLDGEGTFHIFDVLAGSHRFNPLDEVQDGTSLDDLFASFGLDPSSVRGLVQAFAAMRAYSSDDLASTLQVDPAKLADVMKVKWIETRGERIEVPLGEEEAKAGWEAAALWLYGQFFDGLVAKINQALTNPLTPLTMASSTQSTISLLDIFGFEVFDTHNGFEQLCINFTNERIQTVFNHHMFVLEQAVYEAEGLDWTDVDFPSNLPIVDDLNRVLGLVTEECLVPRGNDKALASKLDRLASHGTFSSVGVSASQRPLAQFEVHHYAGPVTYTTKEFCAKNRGDLPPRWKVLLEESSWLAGSWAKLFGCPLVGASCHKSTDQRSNKRLETVLTKFSRNLSSLIQELEATQLHFIRCLKPNDTMTPWFLDHKRIETQLAYCGVLEAIRIARAGFPVRYLHADFEKRFAMIDTGDVDARTIKKGHTKVFLKNETSIVFEARRRAMRHAMATRIQAFRKSCVQRRVFLDTKTRAKTLQEWWRARIVYLHFLALKTAVRALQSRWRFLVVKGQTVVLQRVWKGAILRRRLHILRSFVALIRIKVRATLTVQTFLKTYSRPFLARHCILAKAKQSLAQWQAIRVIQAFIRHAFCKRFAEVGVQVHLDDKRETWTTIIDTVAGEENAVLRQENERLKVENVLLQTEWVQVQESIHDMRQRLDPLLSQLALLREENRELKRIIKSRL